MYSTPPSRPLDSDLEDDVVSTPVELKSKNSRIISDVEKESIQAELAGLEEVYQRVCRVSDNHSLPGFDICVVESLATGQVSFKNLLAHCTIQSPRFLTNVFLHSYHLDRQ